jgi:hypothetical protein
MYTTGLCGKLFCCGHYFCEERNVDNARYEHTSDVIHTQAS